MRRMSTMPGQRTALLVSLGFLTREVERDVTEIINLAVRQNVILNIHSSSVDLTYQKESHESVVCIF